ncbi:MAG: tripartite tricarboxylate transporter permease [Alphaproteobacteria bacterium]|jgi:TctA family transporter|nr:tripartite tricarboxylate transporter permease [Alphaproteobacteria bacterium]
MIGLDQIFAPLINILTTPYLMGLIFLAIPLGMFFGAVPGLGGKLGIVLLIPFVFGMDPLAGAVFLLAMHAVVHTGGSIPSILFGVPGTGPDAATIVDGYPMAQRGEAGRALGASLGASGIGGVIGALFLAAMLPVLKPVILAFSPAEFFLLALFGITFIAMLSGRSLIKGVAVGFLGLMVSLVGLDPHTGSERFTFGQLWLWDGVSVVAAVLGIFAIPEMMSLAVKGGAIAKVQGKAKTYDIAQVFQGILDVFRHPWLTFRTSVIGAAIGAIPGLGGDAASWICYGHAVQSAKDQSMFGKGDVRGVIAPETANNSKEGGSLLPTLFFGVPGSSGMAILIGAFIMLGIQPGPHIALTGMDLVWSLIWALALANLLSIPVFMLMAPAFSLLVFVRGALLIPFVLVLAFLGAYLSESAWENMLILIGLGILGYFLKKFGWPRPPFVIGLVLGHIAEDSIHKALAIWGPTFFLRPLSLVFIAMIIATIGAYIWRQRKTRDGKEIHFDI